MQTPQENTQRNFRIYYIAIFVIAFILYGSSIKNGYSLDDNLVTSTPNSKHPTIEGGISAIPTIFTSHFVVNAKQSYAYRPVVTTTFAIEYQFFGSNPSVSHTISILLYAVSILVLFRLLNQLWGEDKYILTIITCLIFLIHPLHSEVVNNIKCRDELLAFLFGLLALKNAITYYDNKKALNLILVGLFILLSILSKKNGMIFLAIIPLALYYFRTFKFKKLLPVIASLIVAYILFKGMNLVLLSDPVARTKQYFENPLFYMDFSDRIPMFFYSNYYYFVLLLFPYPLRYYYGYDQVPIADWSYPIVIITALVMVVGCFLMFRRTNKKEIWSFGVWFYLLSIGGACNLLFPAVGIIAERFAYVASLGFAITIASLIYTYIFADNAKFKGLIGASKFALVVISAISFLTIVQRSKAWESEHSLYQTDIVNLEKSFKAQTMLAQSHYSTALNQQTLNAPLSTYQTNIDDSYTHLLKSISIFDQYAITYNNLGAYFYTFDGDVDSSYFYFKKAVELDSNYVEALFNLGNLELWLYKTNNIMAQNGHDFIYDSVWEPTPVENFKSVFIKIGSKLEKFRLFTPKLIQLSASNAKTEQDFLSNLENNTINSITKLEIEGLFSKETFKQKIMQNSQEIVESYKSGNLDKHLFNFIASDILSKFHAANTYGKVSQKEINEYVNNNVKYFEKNLVKHFEKSIELSPEYYPPYKGLNEYFTLSNNYKKQIEFNIKVCENQPFEYQHEFYEHIYKAYFKLNDANNCIKYLDLTITDIDKNISDIVNDKSTNPQEIKNKNNLLPQLKLKRISTINKIVEVLKSLNRISEAEEYMKLLNSSE